MAEDISYSLASDVVSALIRGGADTGDPLTIAVAESLTGGLLAGELIRIPGASRVVLGGVIAYNTELKATLLGVDPDLLAEHGAVDPDVAAAMADSVRSVCAVGGKPAAIGISTTGVAGPDDQDGHPPGTVFLGFARGDTATSVEIMLAGDREAIRRGTVSESLTRLLAMLS